MFFLKKRFFEEAKKESHLSDYEGQHLGAVAVYADKFILARGHNEDRTHTSQQRFNVYRVKDKSNILDKPAKLHAEISIYNKIKYLDIDFSRITVYVYRETKKGRLALARCCPACMEALKSLGIKKICYTTDEGYAEERIEQKK